YMLTVQPYIININETTIITLIQENIPPIPSYNFQPQRYSQLISLASATNFLPGQKKKPIPITQSNKFSIFVAKNKLFPPISKLVRLTIWDNEAANFRELNRISTRKNQIVIITSIIPRLHEEKLSLTTTPESRFYFDNDIDVIQRFQKRNKLLS
ncbi:hypothetical protein HID58_039626, partial [Brassica napus]